jgi:hypothetical protein
MACVFRLISAETSRESLFIYFVVSLNQKLTISSRFSSSTHEFIDIIDSKLIDIYSIGSNQNVCLKTQKFERSVYKKNLNDKLIPVMPLPMSFTSKLIVFSTTAACRLFLHTLGSYFTTQSIFELIDLGHFISHYIRLSGGRVTVYNHRTFQRVVFHRPHEVGLVTVSNHASGSPFS